MNNETSLKELQSFFKKRNNEVTEEKSRMLQIIGPHLELIEKSKMSDIDKKRKEKELIDLGKFIDISKLNLKIEEAIRESPDFVLSKKSKRIGLELLDLNLNLEAEETEATIESIFQEVETKLKEESNYLGVYQIDFIDNIVLKGNQEAIIGELLAMIREDSIDQKFIKSINKSPGEDVYLYSNESGSSSTLKQDNVQLILDTKEIKVSTYRENSKSVEIWLLLVLDGAKESSEYSSIDNSVNTEIFSTSFDKLYILDLFKGKLRLLKTKKQ